MTMAELTPSEVNAGMRVMQNNLQQFYGNPPERRVMTRADLGLMPVVASEEEVREWIDRHHGSEDWRGEYVRRLKIMLGADHG
jgi:hypothetical protein